MHMDSQTNLDQRQTQANINKRLSGFGFRDYSTTNFESSKPHKDNIISFVTDDSGTVTIYRGDVPISGTGGKKAVAYTKEPYGGDYVSSYFDDLEISGVADNYGESDIYKSGSWKLAPYYSFYINTNSESDIVNASYAYYTMCMGYDSVPQPIKRTGEQTMLNRISYQTISLTGIRKAKNENETGKEWEFEDHVETLVFHIKVGGFQSCGYGMFPNEDGYWLYNTSAVNRYSIIPMIECYRYRARPDLVEVSGQEKEGSALSIKNTRLFELIESGICVPVQKDFNQDVLSEQYNGLIGYFNYDNIPLYNPEDSLKNHYRNDFGGCGLNILLSQTGFEVPSQRNALFKIIYQENNQHVIVDKFKLAIQFSAQNTTIYYNLRGAGPRILPRETKYEKYDYENEPVGETYAFKIGETKYEKEWLGLERSLIDGSVLPEFIAAGWEDLFNASIRNSIKEKYGEDVYNRLSRYNAVYPLSFYYAQAWEIILKGSNEIKE